MLAYGSLKLSVVASMILRLMCAFLYRRAPPPNRGMSDELFELMERRFGDSGIAEPHATLQMRNGSVAFTLREPPRDVEGDSAVVSSTPPLRRSPPAAAARVDLNALADDILFGAGSPAAPPTLGGATGPSRPAKDPRCKKRLVHRRCYNASQDAAATSLKKCTGTCNICRELGRQPPFGWRPR